MNKSITFVGLDVHKNSIEVALADVGREGEIRHYGSINGDLDSFDRLLRKLVSTGKELHFVYEAGPCGYEIYRHLTSKGFTALLLLLLLATRRKAAGRESRMTVVTL